MASKLFVGGLPYTTTSEDLREYFAQCGTVTSATVVTDRLTGRSRGFGFVEMSTEEEAQAAIAKLGNQSYQGRRLTVNVSNPQASRAGGPRQDGFRSAGGGGGERRRPIRW